MLIIFKIITFMTEKNGIKLALKKQLWNIFFYIILFSLLEKPIWPYLTYT